MPNGNLTANTWTKVLWGWGYWAKHYTVQVGVVGGQYRTYPIYSSGSLPATLTHRVIVYGDVWLYSPQDTWWTANQNWPEPGPA
jgi:hypothetical protein